MCEGAPFIGSGLRELGASQHGKFFYWVWRGAGIEVLDAAVVNLAGEFVPEC